MSGIKLFDNTENKICSNDLCGRINSRLIDEENCIIYMRGVTSTPIWNSGIWFHTRHYDEIIEEIKSSEIKNAVTYRPHHICSYCESDIKEEDSVIYLSRECSYLKRIRNTRNKESTHSVNTIVGKCQIHQGCIDDTISKIKELHKTSVSSRI
jgi:hypothetical protein